MTEAAAVEWNLNILIGVSNSLQRGGGPNIRRSNSSVFLSSWYYFVYDRFANEGSRSINTFIFSFGDNQGKAGDAKKKKHCTGIITTFRYVDLVGF